jgi:hypothetical protein
VYRYESVRLEKVQQLVERVVGVLLKEEKEIMNVFVVKNSEAGLKTL